MKRLAVSIIVILAVASSIWASPGFFLGASFNYDANMLAPAFKEEFEGLGVYNGGDFTALQSIGPRIEFVVLPVAEVPVGLGLVSTTMFPVGYSEGWGATGYFSYKFDFRQDLGVNLFYQQSFGSSWGLFMDLGFTYSWFRFAKENRANSREEVDYIRFTNYGLSADLGFYLEHNGTYFKVGAVLYYDLQHMNDLAFRYGMILGGGVAFG